METEQRIALNDLPKFSPWPARLLGQAHFAAKHRTRDEVLREYDREKWGRVLDALKAGADVSAEELYRLQGVDPEKPIAFARGDELYIAPARLVFEEEQELFASTLRQYPSRILAELGSGLGDKLLAMAARFAPQRIWGGEFTASGVECGRLLASKRGIEAEFARFDYLNPETVLRVPENALVYTSHSVEQIPSLSEAFVDALILRAPQTVIHFEPCYETHEETTLLGLMRRRYTEVNDYNRNLFGLLRSFERRGRIRILDFRKNVLGGVPLNPTSILIWQPA